MRFFKTLSAAALVCLSQTPVMAQSSWPDGKVIKALVPFAAGSATDIIARVVTDVMARELKTSIIVENRAGASGLIGADAIAKSPPDGLSILIGTNSTNAAAPALFKSVPFDHEKDFAPISYIGSIPLIVGVPGTSDIKTLKEFVAKAKAAPGVVNYASASSSQRVSTEMLSTAAGIKLNLVTYRASPQAVADLMAGRVDLFTADLAVMLPQVQANTVRALAVTSSVRIPQLPDVPTVNEALGISGYELIAWFGAFAPANTPAPIIAALNAAIRKAVVSPEVQDKLVKGMGMSISASSPEELAANVKRESAKWMKAATEAGIEKQ